MSRLCLGLLLAGGAVGLSADPPRPSVASTQETIRKLWSKDVEEVVAAMNALEADPTALPVLRRAAVADPDIGHRGVLEKLVGTVEKNRDKEVATRIVRWAADGRLDLLTEVRTLTSGDAAEAATDRLLRAATDLQAASEKLLTDRHPKYPKSRAFLPWADGAAFKKAKVGPQFDAEVAVAENFVIDKRAIFADRIDAPCRYMENSLVVCRSELKHFARTRPYNTSGRSDWVGCGLFANCAVRLDQVRSCVLVIDGDLELVYGGGVSTGVVLVNGDISEVSNQQGAKFSGCVVWATGDITFPPFEKDRHRSVAAAGGKIAGADKLDDKECVLQNAKEPPLPVRFFDPAADYGLTLEAGKDGMTVAKVAEKSAFAEYLKAGDVIAAVTGVKTATAPAFRRELRRGIIEGAVLLDVTRGKEKLELLVPVPDVPPAPKKEKTDDPKARPVEKK